MMLSRISAVLFDFDGTLVDNFRQVFISTVELLRQYGLRPPTENQFRAKVALPFSLTLDRLGLSAVPRRELGRRYIQNYLSHIDSVRIFPDVRSSLMELANLKIEMGIVSQAPRPLLLEHLGRFGISNYFQLVLSGARIAESKPSPTLVLRAIRMLRPVKRTEVLYVGDMVEDVVAARRARIRSCAVYRHGRNFHSLARLRKSKPDFVSTSIRQLLQEVRKHYCTTR
jgi:phosphoglycolate phosphatase